MSNLENKALDYLDGVASDNGLNGAPNTWPTPQPLTAKIESEDYPLDALPEILRAAVEEVRAFVQAPVAMVAASALSAVSLAVQALYDVERASGLSSPVAVWPLTIADSGERKSTCDGFFTKGIKEFEAIKEEEFKPIIKKFKSDLAAWDCEQEGLLSAIKQASKDNKPDASKKIAELKSTLEQHQQNEPLPPRVPRLTYSDITPEELAFKLANGWPSAGIVSAEAGIVFGSHGMKSDSAMKNLAQLNALWDGGDLQVDRRTSESFVVRGARLTMALMVQEATLRTFFDKSGTLARGTGFMARFLISWPESTQGQRPFSEPPKNWPCLDVFNKRVRMLLAQPVPINEGGALKPLMLTFTPAAKTLWINYHDAIEAQLSGGGALFDVRDVASKTADNAARLAALFHVFDGGDGAISADAFSRASQVAVWHLSESRRFFGELAVPQHMADAARLERWMLDHCRREKTSCVNRRVAQKSSTVRNGDRLTAAITELADLDRVRLVKEGKKLFIWLNPEILKEAGL